MFDDLFSMRPCVCCGLEVMVPVIDPEPMCADCQRDMDELERMAELERLRDGIGTADELADYDATRRLLLNGA